MTVLQCAQVVDDAWVLTRKDCDVLCHNYQRMVEWTLKCLLQGWNNKGDSVLFRQANAKKYHVTISVFPTPGSKKQQHSFWVRYPTEHNLYTLENAVARETSFQQRADSVSLNRITMCVSSTMGGKETLGDRISCHEFFIHAQNVDPYILQAWKFMEDTSPTKIAPPTAPQKP